MRKQIYLLFSLFLTTSCHVGEDFESKPFVQNKDIIENLQISSFQNTDVSNKWYEVFKDSDLNTLIQYAVNNNFTVQQGLERLKQSRYALMTHSKQMFPMQTSAIILAKPAIMLTILTMSMHLKQDWTPPGNLTSGAKENTSPSNTLSL